MMTKDLGICGFHTSENNTALYFIIKDNENVQFTKQFVTYDEK